MSGTSERKLGSGAGMSILAGGSQIQYSWEIIVNEEGGKLGLEFSGTALATHTQAAPSSVSITGGR